jgi:hypothetical protein
LFRLGQVWADNLDDELEGLRLAIERYPVVSMVRLAAMRLELDDGKVPSMLEVTVT